MKLRSSMLQLRRLSDPDEEDFSGGRWPGVMDLDTMWGPRSIATLVYDYNFSRFMVDINYNNYLWFMVEITITTTYGLWWITIISLGLWSVYNYNYTRMGL